MLSLIDRRQDFSVLFNLNLFNGLIDYPDLLNKILSVVSQYSLRKVFKNNFNSTNYCFMFFLGRILHTINNICV